MPENSTEETKGIISTEKSTNTAKTQSSDNTDSSKISFSRVVDLANELDTSGELSSIFMEVFISAKPEELKTLHDLLAPAIDLDLSSKEATLDQILLETFSKAKAFVEDGTLSISIADLEKRLFKIGDRVLENIKKEDAKKNSQSDENANATISEEASQATNSEPEKNPESINQQTTLLEAVTNPQLFTSEGETVYLNGSNSTFPSGELAKSWQWSLVEISDPGPSKIELINAEGAQAYFSTPNFHSPYSVKFKLTVKDSAGNSDEANVTVQVSAENNTPSASFSMASSIYEYSRVDIDLSESKDPEGSELTYTWTQSVGPTVTIHNSDSDPYFLAPEVNSTTLITLNLTVSDGAKTSSTYTGSINIEPVTSKFREFKSIEKDRGIVSNHPSLRLTDDFAIEFSINPTSLTNVTLLEHIDSWKIKLTNAGTKIVFDTPNGSVSATHSMTTSSWYHFLFVKSSTRNGIFLNGTQILNSALPALGTPTGDLVIGNSLDRTEGFSGYFDSIVISAGDDQKRTSASSTAPVANEFTRLILHFDGDQINKELDRSLHGNDATFTTAKKEYYLRTLGNDSSSGLSPVSAFASFRKAVSVLTPGDVLWVGAGTYYWRNSDNGGANNNIVLSANGTVAEPIFILADENGEKTGDAGIVKIDGTGEVYNGVHITGSYYTFDGFFLENFRNESGATGAIKVEGNDNTIKNTTVYHSGRDAIYVGGTAANNKFINILIHGIADDGITPTSTGTGNEYHFITIHEPNPKLLEWPKVGHSFFNSLFVGSESEIDDVSNPTFKNVMTTSGSALPGTGNFVGTRHFTNEGGDIFFLQSATDGYSNTSDAIDAGSLAASDSLVAGGSTSPNGTLDTGPVDLGYHKMPANRDRGIGNAATSSGAGIIEDGTPLLSLDASAPKLNSISVNSFNATQTSWNVTFSTAVTGVDKNDFFLVGRNDLSVENLVLNVSGSGANYTVTTASKGSSALTLKLIDNDSIVGSDLKPLGGEGARNGDSSGTY